ncbi:hypothetical protein OBBRIDRAFT_795287 [Obba rivulosa]|uniref:F-box domain-containing protein n=1 Tax=Obba rivulosa TaxID=1052685 RepID=A0A8E2DIV6_9APHY|nr:hypothetical protein OBBRIDRAFT_795287 [Obba rivulosa]
MGQSTSRPTYGALPWWNNDLYGRHVFNVNVNHVFNTLDSFPPSCQGDSHFVQRLHGPRLPIEVWENIIDLAGYPFDRPSMLSCALVCRAWLPRSQFHLFNAVCLRTTRQIRLLGQTICGVAYLRSFVAEISLCLDENAAKSLNLFPDLLSRLPRVVDVTLASFTLYPKGIMLKAKHETIAYPVARWQRRRWRHADDSAIVDTPLGWNVTSMTYTSVRSLTLGRVGFRDFSDFGWILCGFPNLLNLYCSNITWRSAEVNPLAFDVHRDIALKKLNVLKLCFGTVEGRGLGYIVDAVGTSLHTLFLSESPSNFSAGQAMYNLNLRRFTCLSAFYVRNWLYSPQLDNAWLPVVLESMASNGLQHVTFAFHCGITCMTRREMLERMLCPRIDEILSRPQFASLTQVTFAFDDTGNRSYWLAQLRWRMPKFSARGIINVEVWNGHINLGTKWLGFSERYRDDLT